MNKRAFKRSLLASVGRLIGVVLGATAGSLIKDLVVQQNQQWGLPFWLCALSFVLIWVSEYEREITY